MARPNILTYKGNGKLQYINDSEFNGIAEVVLEKFATVDGPGNIYDANGGGSYTTIGTFTDTRFQGTIGSGGVTILSSSTTLYQDLTTNYGTVTDSPVHWSSTQESIKKSDDNDLNDLADEIISYMVNSDGPGTYTLAISAPAGGTWQSIGSIDNINDEGTTTTYNLYKKIAGEVALSQSPLKIQGSSLKVMSQAEIEQLTEKVRERIVSNGIGQYAFQGAAPGTGTWADKGTITDTRPTTSPQNYEGPSYEGSYIGTVPSLYTGEYVGDYVGTAGAVYVGNYIGNYTGTYSGSYVGNYTSTFAGSFTSTYLKTYIGAGSAPYSGSYTASYTGSFVSSYTGAYDGQFTGPGPSLAYIGAYTGTATAAYAGNYTGLGPINYQGPGDVNYTGAYTGTIATTYNANFLISYLNSYTGTRSVNYTGSSPVQYAATASYAGTVPGPSYVDTLFAFFYGTYTGGSGPTQYAGPFFSDSIFLPYLEGAYVGPAATSYRYYLQYYSGGRQTYFTGSSETNYTGGYLGTRELETFTGPPTAANFSGTAYFTGFVPVNYTGTTTSNFNAGYLQEYTGSFTGFSPANYSGTYTSTLDASFYTSDQPLVYTGVYNSLVPINYEGAYTGINPTTYTGLFSGSFSSSYTGTYDGSSYTGTYVGTTNNALYVADYLRLYTGAYDGTTFAGTYIGNYDGQTFTGTYLGNYDGSTQVNYLGNYVGNYTGVTNALYLGDYGSTYLGAIINNDSSTISTLTLWRRIG